MTVTIFKQLPPAQIGPKFKNFFAHQIANDQTIVMIIFQRMQYYMILATGGKMIIKASGVIHCYKHVIQSRFIAAKP